MNKYIATKNDENRKIINFIKSIFKNAPESLIRKLFRKKEIKINSKKINDPNYILKENDEIIIYSLKNEIFYDNKENKAILTSEIIYEDDNIIVINKKSGIVVHSEKESLDNQIYNYLNFIQVDSFKPTHIGRLDKETSGIIVYAKKYSVLIELQKKKKLFEKIYTLKSDYKVVEPKIIEFYSFKNDSTKNMDYSKHEVLNSKINITKIFSENGTTFAQIFTGRKHQIRLTMKYLKNPIYGDVKYGGRKDKRIYLHSYKIVFKGLEGELEYLNNKIFISNPNW
ncbi:Pseudouridylate synthase [Mycoplasmopsis maculosa]|uniref:RNA pseudouridylate synthase n=1 Tax=Mycoplasmopsis maculosa TaxID=114885 RepID=A0A449B4Q9_9BACT|nr:RluA family pseudouridine synthase [Mycoplasmopsis maculosa]VEU75518.1 Pseudouridylate synthase [Mycoplasmopsis maculosa]